MPKATLSEPSSDFTVMAPETIIGVRVKECEVRVLDGRYGEWEKLEVEFEIIDAPDPYKDLIGKPVWGGIPFRFEDDPENPMLQWTEAILGFDVSGQLGFQIDTDDWINKECRGVISNYQKKNGETRHSVDSLLPKSGGGLAAPNAPTTEAASESSTQSSMPTVTDDDVPF